MRQTRVVVTMQGGEVGRVFLVEGTDEEFGQLQEGLREVHEVEFAVRVATGEVLPADKAMAVIACKVLEDQMEQDVLDRGDPEEMEVFGPEAGLEDCRGGDAEEMAVGDAFGGSR